MHWLLCYQTHFPFIFLSFPYFPGFSERHISFRSPLLTSFIPYWPHFSSLLGSLAPLLPPPHLTGLALVLPCFMDIYLIFCKDGIFKFWIWVTAVVHVIQNPPPFPSYLPLPLPPSPTSHMGYPGKGGGWGGGLVFLKQYSKFTSTEIGKNASYYSNLTGRTEPEK